MIIFRFNITDKKRLDLEKILLNLHHQSKIKNNEMMVVQTNEYESVTSILKASGVDFVREIY